MTPKQRMAGLVPPTLLVVFFTVFLILFSPLFSYAAEQEGRVDATAGLYLRTGPGTEYATSDLMPYGATVDVLDEVFDSAGAKWYQVSYKNQQGYCFALYLTVKEKETYTTDPAFEQYLTEQGFPESYKEKLRALYAVHPEWKYEAQKTGLDYGEVLEKECAPLVNTDHSGTVTASKEEVDKYLDPRNGLSEPEIFQFLSNKYDPRYHTKDGLQRFVAGTFLQGTPLVDGSPSYVDIIMNAASQSGVSPYSLASKIRNEVGTNGGGLIVGDGYYNYFNYGAYGTGTEAIANGLAFAKEQGWDSPEKAIIGGAVLYGEGYINNNQDTNYLEKFNVMNGEEKVATHQYMQAVYGAESLGRTTYEAFQHALSLPFIFKIPIYNNMPGTGVVVPPPVVPPVNPPDPSHPDDPSTPDHPARSGWVQEDGGRRYYPDTDHYLTGLQTIEGLTYYFNDNGFLQGGHQVISGTPYQFYSSEGYAYSAGWINYSDGKTRAYCLGDGRLATGLITIDGLRYYFGSDGFLQGGYQVISGTPYQFYSSDGYAYSAGWINYSDGKTRAYCLGDGRLATGLVTIDGLRYYFASDGFLQGGYQVISGTPYQFYSSDGYAYSAGWINYSDGKTRAYCLGDGRLATGLITIDGLCYYFNSDGFLQGGYQVISGTPYQFYSSEGYAYSAGWINYSDGKTRAYCLGDGRLATGLTTIDGLRYYFGDDGFLR